MEFLLVTNAGYETEYAASSRLRRKAGVGWGVLICSKEGKAFLNLQMQFRLEWGTPKGQEISLFCLIWDLVTVNLDVRWFFMS